jgi:hypothetical protein
MSDTAKKALSARRSKVSEAISFVARTPRSTERCVKPWLRDLLAKY